MTRDFDPNDLSAGDVIRIVAPSAAVIVGLLITLFLAARFEPDFTNLFIVLTGIGVFVVVARLPKQDLADIYKKEREIEEKICSTPIDGPVAKPAWRLFKWLTGIMGMIVLILLVLDAVMDLW